MKIKLDHADRLALSGSTVFLSGALVALVLLITGIGVYAGTSGHNAGWYTALAALFLGGAILWLVYHKTEAVFDRDANTLTIRKAMLHGTRKDVVPLDSVRQADVDLKRNKDNNNRLHASYTYRLCIVTDAAHGRHRTPLSHGFTTSKRHLYSAKKINDWLGVSHAPIGTGPGMADIQEFLKSIGFGQKT